MNSCFNFKMYAEYEDGFSYYTMNRDEEECMSDIADQCDIHGNCTFYTGVSGYDEKNDCYWEDGERFRDFDEDKQEYIK